MLFPKSRVNSALLAVSSIAFLLLPACSVNVKKNADQSDKNVDINTPIGGIHVSEEAGVRDIGLPVYPGARPKPSKEDGEEKSADVSISTPYFGLKVVAQEFESDDPPDKLIKYYDDQLKKYGTVLECHSTWHKGDLSVHMGNNKSGKDSKELTCKNGGGKATELKVGTKDNQYIVAIEPAGKGSSFALVYVAARGKEAEI